MPRYAESKSMTTLTGCKRISEIVPRYGIDSGYDIRKKVCEILRFDSELFKLFVLVIVEGNFSKKIFASRKNLVNSRFKISAQREGIL